MCYVLMVVKLTLNKIIVKEVVISLGSEFILFLFEDALHVLVEVDVPVDAGLAEIGGVLGGDRGHELLVPLGPSHVVLVGPLVVLQQLGLRGILVELLRELVRGLDLSGVHPELGPLAQGLIRLLDGDRLGQLLFCILVLWFLVGQDLVHVEQRAVVLLLVIGARGVVGGDH